MNLNYFHFLRLSFEIAKLTISSNPSANSGHQDWTYRRQRIDVVLLAFLPKIPIRDILTWEIKQSPKNGCNWWILVQIVFLFHRLIGNNEYSTNLWKKNSFLSLHGITKNLCKYRGRKFLYQTWLLQVFLSHFCMCALPPILMVQLQRWFIYHGNIYSRFFLRNNRFDGFFIKHSTWLRNCVHGSFPINLKPAFSSRPLKFTVLILILSF